MNAPGKQSLVQGGRDLVDKYLCSLSRQLHGPMVSQRPLERLQALSPLPSPHIPTLKFPPSSPALVCSGCYNKNTGCLITTEISFSQFWRLEVQDHGGVLVRALFQVYRRPPLRCVLTLTKKGEGSLWGPFYKALTSFTGAPPS